MITQRNKRFVPALVALALLFACATEDMGQSLSGPAPLEKNTVRIVVDKPLYGKDALRAMLASHREDIHELQTDPALRSRTDNPDSVVYALQVEARDLEEQIAIPEMTRERADSLRAFFRSNADELVRRGQSAGEVNGHWTTVYQLKKADSILSAEMDSGRCYGLRLASYSSTINARGTQVQSTQRTANLFSPWGIAIPDLARQAVDVEIYVNGSHKHTESARTGCGQAQLNMRNTVSLISTPVLSCHPALDFNVSWDGIHRLWTGSAWTTYLSGSSRTVTLPENRTGCNSCNSGGGEGDPPAPGSCNGGGTGVPPNECEWVTVELYIGGLLVSSWRVRACWGQGG